MQKIDSRPKTVNDLLKNKYKLDYYQREYSWQTKQVTELIDDLVGKFWANYKEEDKLKDVPRYDPYFLGSLIISEENHQRNIIDGQQRLTTLTLFLIHLRRLLSDDDQKMQVAMLIFSGSFVDKSFNLDIPDRSPVMNALYNGDPFEAIHKSESIRNIASRYGDIENHFELPERAIPYFVYWLLERVYLAEITVYTDEDAYTIFETMNDRGLSLTSADMLRGYLLSKITDAERRDKASEVWSECSRTLNQIGREDESEAIKAWLRSQYAENLRDFERIGSEFHRWIRHKEGSLGLISSDDFANFIESDFEFYSKWYDCLQQEGKEFTTADFECVYYNAQNKFTLQYPVLLSPLCVGDTDETVLQKIRIVATYLDILIYRRIWNFFSINQNSMVSPMFSVMHDIRGKSSTELVKILCDKLNHDPFLNLSDNNQMRMRLDFPGFSTSQKSSVFANQFFRLTAGNRGRVRLILARMTDYLEIQVRSTRSRYSDYIKTGSSGYEVEHIWANCPDRHTDEFPQETDFQEYRNRIGGLLLLPKNVNASMGDDPYTEKRKSYVGQNLLAASLYEQTYVHNPNLRSFIQKSKLPFKHHPEFKKADLDARQKLYQLLAEQIWNPERLREDAS